MRWNLYAWNGINHSYAEYDSWLDFIHLITSNVAIQVYLS